jgi:hypothetical protein
MEALKIYSEIISFLSVMLLYDSYFPGSAQQVTLC